MIKKQYLKSKPSCKVTFSFPKEAVTEKTEIRVVGDFNDWNWEEGAIMKASKNEYKVTLELPTGSNYEFRYLMANGNWANDWDADAYVPSPYYGIDNSVVTIEATAKGNGAAAPKAVETVKAKAAPKKAAAKKTTAKKVAAKKTTAKKAAPKKAKKDNLKKIEGIGPKIEKLLQAKGIVTFADLAKAKQKTLKEVLADAGSRFRMHDPTTWPEQAALAAAGETEKLAKLQDELKGGKR